MNVVTRWDNADEHTRQPIPLGSDLGDKVTRYISKKKFRLIHSPLALPSELFKKLLRGLSCDFSQSSNGLLRIRAILDNKINVERGPISNENLAISIKDQTARRWDIHHSKTIILRAVAKHVPINDLEMPEPER
jgi:hypothetical protein